MIRQITLEGTIGDKFGAYWELKAKNMHDILNGINVNTSGFRDYLTQAAQDGTNFQIMSGEDFLDEEEVTQPLDSKDIVIVELPQGAKGGTGKIIAGALMIALLFVPGGAGVVSASGSLFGAATAAGAGNLTIMTALTVGSIGINLISTGIQQLLAPDPSVDNDKDKNYLFDGPENTVIAGQPMPYLFGRKVIGGAPISSTVQVGNLPPVRTYRTYSDPYIPNPGDYGGNVGGGGGGGFYRIDPVYNNDTSAVETWYDAIYQVNREIF